VDTRRKIAKVAVALFVRKGIAATTTRDIAAAASIAEGTIYRHYAGKEALAEEIYRSNYLALHQELDQIRRAAPDAETALTGMVRRFYTGFDEHPDLVTYMVIALHGQMVSLPPKARTTSMIMREVLRQGMKAGTIRKMDADLAAQIALGIILQPAKAVHSGEYKFPLTPIVPEIVAAICRALAP